jgi:hypothetical protein
LDLRKNVQACGRRDGQKGFHVWSGKTHTVSESVVVASFHMSLTPHHAKYFAHELTKRSSSESVDKLASALWDAQVDLNPHQIDAALFAFRSPPPLWEGRQGTSAGVANGGPITHGMALPLKGCPSSRTNKLDLTGGKEGLESTSSLNMPSVVSALKLHGGSGDLEIIREE